MTRKDVGEKRLDKSLTKKGQSGHEENDQENVHEEDQEEVRREV